MFERATATCFDRLESRVREGGIFFKKKPDAGRSVLIDQVKESGKYRNAKTCQLYNAISISPKNDATLCLPPFLLMHPDPAQAANDQSEAFQVTITSARGAKS